MEEAVTRRLILLCVGFATLSVLTVVTKSRRAERPHAVGVAQSWLYCPECGLEMTCPTGAEGSQTFCPHCGPKYPMQVSAVSRGAGEGQHSGPKLLVMVVAFAVPAALAVAVYAASRARHPPEDEPAPERFDVSCPACGHAMTSTALGPGSRAVCPDCAHPFVVPDKGTAGKPADHHGQVTEWGRWLGGELAKKTRVRRRRGGPGP
jgi:hypothetical protein